MSQSDFIVKKGLTVNGDITVSGQIDNVDLEEFKLDYDTHNHNSEYYTQTKLSTSGQASVHWNNITDLPLYTSIDVNTSYSTIISGIESDSLGNITGVKTRILSAADIGLEGVSEQIEIIAVTNTITLSNTPKGIEYIHLYKNGIILRRTIDYTLDESDITLAGGVDNFTTDDDIYVEYYK